MNKPEIYNGQFWEQKDFPYFKVMVLMLPHVDGVLMFSKVGIRQGEPPLVMTEKDGTWMYSAADLLARLRENRYTVINDVMVWTTAVPVRAGFYYWKGDGFSCDEVAIVQVNAFRNPKMALEGDELLLSRGSVREPRCCPVSEFGGKWAGPLPQPREGRPWLQGAIEQYMEKIIKEDESFPSMKKILEESEKKTDEKPKEEENPDV